jgi:hypothetical protein
MDSGYSARDQAPMEDHPWDIANDEISTQAAIRMYRERGEEVPEPWRSMLERGERVRHSYSG